MYTYKMLVLVATKIRQKVLRTFFPNIFIIQTFFAVGASSNKGMKMRRKEIDHNQIIDLWNI